MKPLLIILSTALMLSRAVAGEPISVSALRQEIVAKTTGTYIVKDTVDRISVTLTPGKYEVRMGGDTFPILLPVEPDVKYSFSSNTIFKESKRTSAQHYVGSSRFDKTPLVQVGQSTLISVVLSGGRVQEAQLLTTSDRPTATTAKYPARTASTLEEALGADFNVTSPTGSLGSGKTNPDGSVTIQTIDGVAIKLKPSPSNPERFTVSTSQQGHVGTGKISEDGTQLIVNTTTGQVVRFRIK